MGKRKLFIGMAAGAIAGGLAALLDKETRVYTKNKLSQAKEKSGQLVKNPSETVRDMRLAFDQLSQNVTVNIQKAVNTLDQVEQSLDKVSKKKLED